jgi:anti-sigma factor RsiW
MRDDQIKELISAYLDDELSVEERALVERHLADSVECQQFLDRIRQQRLQPTGSPGH